MNDKDKVRFIHQLTRIVLYRLEVDPKFKMDQCIEIIRDIDFVARSTQEFLKLNDEKIKERREEFDKLFP